MVIVIRADSSSEIGIGHMMRCLTIAQELRKRGANISFICRDLPGHIGHCATEKGFNVELLPASQWNWQEDADRTVRVLQRFGRVDCVIVDHYDIDYQWEALVGNFTGKIVVIDDLANRLHQCDVLVDANMSDEPERYGRLVPEFCRLLLGTSYAMLRDEFREEKVKQRIRTGEIKRLLVFFGGSDPTMETLRVLQVLKNNKYAHLSIDIIVGHSNTKRERVAELCETLPNMQCSIQVENMAERMRKADLSIGAGGSATWERCYMGLPAIVIVTAENQLALTELVSETGAVRYLGTSRHVNEWMIERTLDELLNNSTSVREMSEKAEQIMGEDRFYELIDQIMEG
ncbi:UDP-2,4-diacetamido-2,4,6-trideoxy-beta-L-altropyranose hydrolase [Bacillus sp. AGMB 02131]|uniref:UDP-2,4-diacetamido-2,4, 6-trideoxy-beta-L-altropyranose hydrolase n=1 Tax=Peribacillus faecalis TaxID=2772559 RepID=A0A927CXR3_9BACI|nr:UDP-2,4-diacetamido-2,4,6-trideoxy-beta-L-altropyranose hydrolase [Peribacillus faecalis]MBD3109667.1 UDP-2,4-diacetamido-2,4,6-trideoxy-beta-L-altropyranose hydrolase [Peribacillus faecalis]